MSAVNYLYVQCFEGSFVAQLCLIFNWIQWPHTHLMGMNWDTIVI